MRYVLLLALLVTNASAEAPKYKRSAVSVPTVRSRPEVQRKAEPAKPSLTATQILAIDLALQPVRREQEILLEKLVRDTPDTDDEKPDHMFRLAEQYAKQLRLWRLRAIELDRR
jgi:hypothetical protein